MLLTQTSVATQEQPLAKTQVLVQARLFIEQLPVAAGQPEALPSAASSDTIQAIRSIINRDGLIQNDQRILDSLQDINTVPLDTLLKFAANIVENIAPMSGKDAVALIPLLGALSKKIDENNRVLMGAIPKNYPKQKIQETRKQIQEQTQENKDKKQQFCDRILTTLHTNQANVSLTPGDLKFILAKLLGDTPNVNALLPFIAREMPSPVTESDVVWITSLFTEDDDTRDKLAIMQMLASAPCLASASAASAAFSITDISRAINGLLIELGSSEQFNKEVAQDLIIRLLSNHTNTPGNVQFGAETIWLTLTLNTILGAVHLADHQALTSSAQGFI